MVITQARLFVNGDRFSPTAAEAATGLRFARKGDPGELGRSGRYRGMPVPYGWAELDAVGGVDFLTTVDGPFFTAAAALIRSARMQGTADARVHVDVEHDGQCNLEVAVARVDRDTPAGDPVDDDLLPSRCLTELPPVPARISGAALAHDEARLRCGAP